jgi:hypothetical protein
MEYEKRVKEITEKQYKTEEQFRKLFEELDSLKNLIENKKQKKHWKDLCNIYAAMELSFIESRQN